MAYQLRYVNLFDDINSTNINDITEFYAIANLKVEDKFYGPDINDTNKIRAELNQINRDNILKYIKNHFNLDNSTIEIMIDSFEKELKMLAPTESSYTSGVIKVLFWLSTIFSSVLNENEHNIFINTTVSKYEIYCIYLLSKLNNNIVLIDYNYNKELYKLYNNFKDNCTGTKERLKIVIKPNVDFDTILEKVTKDSIDIPACKIYITGEDEQLKLNKFLVNIGNESSTVVYVFKNGIEKPTYEEVNSTPRPSASTIQQLVNRIGTHMFSRNNKEYANKAVDFCKQEINRETNINKAVTRLIEFISIFGRYSFNYNCYIYYGKVNSPAEFLLNFLNYLGKVIIVVDTNGESTINKEDYIEIKLSEPVQYHEYPSLSSSTTIAYNASKEMDQVLYNGNTLGLYRDRQYKTCNVTTIMTTFDEMFIWWHQENKVKPSFDSSNNIVTIPVFYTKLLGTCEGYLDKIHQFITEHTIVRKNDEISNLYNIYNGNCKMVINHGASTNGVLFKHQKPMIKNDKLEIEVIKNYPNFSYQFLSEDVQYHILSKIDMIIQKDLVDYGNTPKSEYYDMVLRVGLNLSQEILQYMQWYDYTKESPKLLVILNTQNMLDLASKILLTLLHICGWDIVVAIPTHYNLTGNLRDMQEIILGEPSFDINLNNLDMRPFDKNKMQKQTKKSIFGRIFK